MARICRWAAWPCRVPRECSPFLYARPVRSLLASAPTVWFSRRGTISSVLLKAGGLLRDQLHARVAVEISVLVLFTDPIDSAQILRIDVKHTSEFFDRLAAQLLILFARRSSNVLCGVRCSQVQPRIHESFVKLLARWNAAIPSSYWPFLKL